jgi:hypothetical protein
MGVETGMQMTFHKTAHHIASVIEDDDSDDDTIKSLLKLTLF